MSVSNFQNEGEFFTQSSALSPDLSRSLKPDLTSDAKWGFYAMMTAVDFFPSIFMVSGFLRMTCFR